MTSTPNLELAYLAAGQAQKHVTVNEALRRLDALVQLSVKTRTLATPPTAPFEGQRHLVPSGATGSWSTHANALVAWQDGGWIFYPPQTGWLAYVEDESALFAYDGVVWQHVSADYQNLPMLGVNATADTTNRLSVSAPATLLSHQGQGHQLKLNKAATGDTASLLLQAGFSGRAEIGLCGDNRLAFKTSQDGQNWAQAFVVDPATANLGIGLAVTTATTRLAVESPDGGTARFVNGGAGGAGGGAGILTYTYATPVAAGDRFGQILFGSLTSGSSPSGVNSAGFSAHAEAAWTVGTSHPSYIRFDTTPTGSAGRLERLRITASGKVGVGIDAPSTTLHVNGPARVGSYSVATAPSASSSGAGAIIYVSNEVGGAVLAFSDGAVWRRVTDRAAIA